MDEVPLKSYCDFAPGHPFHGPYHEREYGFPLADDDALFERLVLEINQAGLSWLTILKKREAFRRAYDGFAVDRVAAYGDAERARLLADAGIVRNRLKIEATIDNAKAYLALRERTSLAAFLWGLLDGRALQNRFAKHGEIPAQTDASVRLSKALKKEGFRFVGPTTVYAFMQSVGMVNDHLADCHRHGPCAKAQARFKRPR